MKIVIISGAAYPHGMAISRRIHLMARGIAQEGQEVNVLVINPTELPFADVQQPISGKDEYGVSFLYTGGHRKYSPSWLCRRLQNFMGLQGTLAWLWRNRKTVDAVLMYTSNVTNVFACQCMCRAISVKLVFCRSEHPFYNNPWWLRRWIIARGGLKGFDGYVLISRGIELFFREMGISDSLIMRMPILSDDLPCGRNSKEASFNSLEEHKKTIFYCGDWSEYKDGLLALIRAFAQIAHVFPDVVVELAGTPAVDASKIDAIRLIKELNIEDRVRIIGYLDAEEFRLRMMASTMFVLPKPDNFQARYSMPSKLADYLMTGRPVVVSDVGDLSDYLQHEVSAYFVPPGNVSAVAEAMKYVLTHPEEAIEVGHRGQAVARESFHYRRNTHRLIKFLYELPSKKRGPKRREM